MTRHIGKLETPESCRKECERLYKLASKGEIDWQDAEKGAAVLTRLFKMNGGNSEQTEGKWGDVGKNALHR